MRRFFACSLSCASLLAILAALPSDAGAKPARHVRHAPRAHVVHYVADNHTGAPPLTIRQRSFLDPGNVVPVNSATRNYVNDSTIFNRTTDQTFARSKFGNEALPGPFDLPGRQQPLIDFSTGGYGE